MYISLQTLIVSFILCILGYYAAIVNKRGKVNRLRLIVGVGIIIYGIHVYTATKSLREEYKVSIEKFEQQIKLYEKDMGEIKLF